MRRRLVLASALALCFAPAAAATDVSSREFRALAGRAADDPKALARLREVDSVDGRRIDLERALGGAAGDELELRLRALAARPSFVPAPAEARERARAILSERRFQEETAPRPLRRPLEWLSGYVRRAGRALGRAVEWLSSPLPGGESTFWTLVALAVAAAGGLGAIRVARRRTGTTAERRRRAVRSPRLDPSRLERRADAAERSGDLELALRLRFRAGLVRLALLDAVPLRDSMTSGEIRRRLRLREFDVLAGTFDEVVYGGRAPERGDLEQARAGWPRVVEAVVAR